MADETKVCPQCSETVQKAALMCRFCNHRFDAPAGASAAPAKKGLSGCVIFIIVAGASIPVLAILSAIAIPALLQSRRAANEHVAVICLKQLAAAEMAFKVGDLDGNGVEDYWTRDIRSLSRMTVKDRPLNLIENGIAQADVSTGVPLPHVPKNGYVFLAMQTDADGKPYDLGQGRNPLHFAFCAYPIDPKAGRKTFIINENNQIWVRPYSGSVYEWPSNPAQMGFTPMD